MVKQSALTPDSLEDARPAIVEAITVDDLRNLMGELRAMARWFLQSESNPQSLTPTALALTALRRAKAPDVAWDDLRWENRKHFFSVLSMTMNHALIDHARRARAKRRPPIQFLAWNDQVLQNLPDEAENRPELFFVVEEAMAKLNKVSPESAEVIKLYFYAQYTIPEIARFSDVCTKTVNRRLREARAMLGRLVREALRE